MECTNRSHRLYRICFLAILFLTLIIAVCGTVALWTTFDQKVGYLDPSPLSVICTVALAVAVGIAVILPMFIPARTLPTQRPAPMGLTGYLFCGLSAVALGAFTVLTFLSAPAPLSAITVASLVCALGAAAYFVVVSLPLAEKKPLLAALLGVFPIFWALLCIAETYTDWTVAINSPIKLSVQFGCAGIMLMMTAEQRYRIGKAAPRLALSLYSLAVLLCLGAGIPLTLAMVKEATVLRHSVCLFAVGLYAVKRMADFMAVAPVNGNEA